MEFKSTEFDNNLLYRDYEGSISYSHTDRLFYGKVLGIRSLISYEGADPEELEKDFREMLDFYLESSEEDGIPIEVPEKESWDIQLGKDLYQKAFLYAIKHDQTLEDLVVESNSFTGRRYPF